jgi:hypothetical protein
VAGISWSGRLWESGPVSDYEPTSAPDHNEWSEMGGTSLARVDGSRTAKLVLEAMRRAIDIRDTRAKGVELSVRPVVLVDVFNALGKSPHAGGSDIWDGSDLWHAFRLGEGYDEAAICERNSRR